MAALDPSLALGMACLGFRRLIILRPRIKQGDSLNMSKAAFIDLVAGLDKKDVLSKADAKRQIDRVFGAIEAGLKPGKDKGYVIGRFGTFKITKRGARKGRNPRTGEAIKIKASKTLRFKPAASLKKAAGV